MQFYHYANGLLLAGMLFIYFRSYDQLPVRIPTHFGFDGTPDGWSEKSNLLIFVVVAFVVTSLLYLFKLFLPSIFKNPWMINIPRKYKAMQIGGEVLNKYMNITAEMLIAIAAGLNLLFFLGLYSTIYMIINELPKLPWWGIWIGLPIVLIVSFTYTVLLYIIPNKKDNGHEGEYL
jgi:uncharacterized membrane protein